jgi:hypothetical protein
VTKSRRRAFRRVLGCSSGAPDPVLECRAGEDVGDELVAVEARPALLGAREQLERHPERGGLRAGALGHARAQLDGGEARLDRIRGSQMPPVLGAERAERGELAPVAVELVDCPGVLGRRTPRRRSRGRPARRVRSALPSSDAAASWPAAAGAWGGRRGRWRSCAPTALLARRDDVAHVCRLPVRLSGNSAKTASCVARRASGGGRAAACAAPPPP